MLYYCILCIILYLIYIYNDIKIAKPVCGLRTIKPISRQCDSVLELPILKLFPNQLLTGVAYYHHNCVLHRDLNPRAIPNSTTSTSSTTPPTMTTANPSFCELYNDVLFHAIIPEEDKYYLSCARISVNNLPQTPPISIGTIIAIRRIMRNTNENDFDDQSCIIHVVAECCMECGVVAYAECEG